MAVVTARPGRDMTDQGHHCPFLNRADSRCSRHFSLDSLGHAFDYCFDSYEGCSVYLELLVERRVRRSRGAGAFDGGCVDGAGDGGTYYDNLIQVTVAGRIAHGAADPSLVSHASGF
jgi:hypothetical protein